MRKTIQNEIVEWRCDNCKKVIEFIAAELEFSYGSKFDEKDFIFCSDKCLKEFVIREVK